MEHLLRVTLGWIRDPRARGLWVLRRGEFGAEGQLLAGSSSSFIVHVCVLGGEGKGVFR